jgi:5-methylcytosine-specific restriction enzyme subunit McrC
MLTSEIMEQVDAENVDPEAPRFIQLSEQMDTDCVLRREDAAYMKSTLRFDVTLTLDQTNVPIGQLRWCVNPRQWAGQFRLPCGDTIGILPKIGGAQVMRLLCYVHDVTNIFKLQKDEVFYAELHGAIFEPLIVRLSQLVETRVKRGLSKEYVSYDENLGVVRGKILIGEHLSRNSGHPERILCRHHLLTPDTEHNRFIKWTLWKMLQVARWRHSTYSLLKANLRQFHDVTLVEQNPCAKFVYGRLNQDYRELHHLCRLLLSLTSIAEGEGRTRFHGLLINMNFLFEAFIRQAFVKVAPRMTLSARKPESSPLSADGSLWVEIQPDIVVRDWLARIAIVDAKYKRLSEAGPPNADIFQMVSYGTVLQCPRAFLVYPQTEIDMEGEVIVRASPIRIGIRRVNLESADCCQLMETQARAMLLSSMEDSTHSLTAYNPIRVSPDHSVGI